MSFVFFVTIVVSSAAIKEKALELGFDLCGIAPAERFPELAFFREWIDRGYAGEMAYLPRTAERRADVREVVPGARSVIVTATLYNTVAPYEDDASPGTALISRYAWGDDYHDVLKRRLDALLLWMRAESADPFDAYPRADSTPTRGETRASGRVTPLHGGT